MNRGLDLFLGRAAERERRRCPIPHPKLCPRAFLAAPFLKPQGLSLLVSPGCSSWCCPSQEGEEQTEDTTGSIFLPNAHPSPSGHLGDAGLGFSLPVITQIPHPEQVEPRGEPGEGAGLAPVTVISGGHREGT